MFYMQSFDHINHKLDRDKVNSISGSSREHMNTPAVLAAVARQHSASAPVDEPPSVFKSMNFSKVRAWADFTWRAAGSTQEP